MHFVTDFFIFSISLLTFFFFFFFFFFCFSICFGALVCKFGNKMCFMLVDFIFQFSVLNRKRGFSIYPLRKRVHAMNRDFYSCKNKKKNQ